MRQSRREFLKRSALGFAALSLPSLEMFPRQEPAPKKRVLILGAGLAGLVAAHELNSLGHDVTLLEASQRPGGRVYTLREPFAEGQYAEAGAGRIPEWHHLTLLYVKLFGLKLEPFRPEHGMSITCLRDRRIKLKPGEDLGLTDLPFALSAAEKKLSLDGLEAEYIDPILKTMGDPAAPNWLSETLKPLDHLTWVECLRRKGASRGAVELLAALNGWEWDSALDFFRDDLGHRGTKKWFKIRGGMDLLPKAFAERLANKIHYASEVVRIEQDDKSARAVCKESGGTQTYSADRIICTIPFSVLRGMEIAPKLSPAKQEIVDRIYYDPVVRVYVQTRKRFWQPEGLNGFADTDDPAEIWQPTFTQPGERGILHTYLENGLTAKVAAMPEAERIRHSLQILERAFPGTKENTDRVHSFCWADQPFARGAYVAFAPGQLTRWSRAVYEPEGRLHFAGEHTSSFPGWMQGALESGMRAAREIHTAA
ncbi:MAG TPA: FAD-dependent oxidoreductase [Candidatus Acidoferrales bacterium]|nr:FAD-dependent oxidoreductase [Candidatus Acidoferrales bacterium]